MDESTWFVGSNGNWFRDMAGARYCVDIPRSTDGRLRVMRNGEDLGVAYPYADVTLAKAAAERHAQFARRWAVVSQH